MSRVDLDKTSKIKLIKFYYENCRSGQGKKNLFGQKEKGKKEKEQKNLKMRGKDDLRAQLRALHLTIFSLLFLLPPNIYRN